MSDYVIEESYEIARDKPVGNSKSAESITKKEILDFLVERDNYWMDHNGVYNRLRKNIGELILYDKFDIKVMRVLKE